MTATIKEMHEFLKGWACVCGTCFVCEACVSVCERVDEEE